MSALETLRKAFPDAAGALRAHLIAGLAAVIAVRPRLPKSILQQALAGRGLAVLEGDILKAALAGKEKRAAIAEAEILKLLPVELRKPEPRSQAPMSIGANKANAGRVLMPASVSAAKRSVPKSTSRSADEAAIAEHIAKKGVTKLPPAAAAATSAVFKSELPEIERSTWIRPPKNAGAKKAHALRKVTGVATRSAARREKKK